MKPFFSIIVPVYNVEQYLNDCVESVVNQSFSDWELLLVDDGSNDRSSSICDEYAEKDERIRVFHKENGGASSARNVGISAAIGEYYLFLDSDDYWNDCNMLKILKNKLNNTFADIILFGCTDFNMVTGERIVSRTGYDLSLIYQGSCDKTIHYLLHSKMIPGASYIFATSAKIFNNVAFYFKEGVQNEDYDFVLSMFLNAKSITAVDNPFYMYRKGRNDSVTGISSIKMIYGIDYTLKKWIPITETIENKQIKNDVLNYLSFIYSTGFVILGRLPKQDVPEALKIMKAHKGILKYGYWRKTKIIKIADAILGDRLFSKISVVYFRKTHIGV